MARNILGVLIGITGLAVGACAGDMGSSVGNSIPSDTPVLRPSNSMGPLTEATPSAGAGTPTAPVNPGMTPVTPPTTMVPTEPVTGTGVPPQQPPNTVPPAPVDACSGRVVSYSKPCHNNPDPCGLNSGWPGDEYCLLKPKDGEGIQIHFGPTDYKQPGEYVIMPGQEFDNSVLAHIPLDSDRFYNHIQVNMRPGSHHWISSSAPGKPREGFYNGSTTCNDQGSGFGVGGGQNLIYDNPPGGIPAPENAGIGSPIRGNSSLCLNYHNYNLTDRPQLREIWINIYFVDQAKVTQPTRSIAMVGGLGLMLPPGQKQVKTHQGTFSGPGRIIQMFGHRHKWTPRFATWLNDELIYDSHSWKDSVTFNYDSITTNPPIDPNGVEDGAKSGIIEFKAGDVLKFSCFVENESMEVLRFKNDLDGGEMCNLWGTTVGTGIGGSFF